MDPVDEQTPFIFAGQCDDEVIFTFDNTDKQLFVSRNFLILVSPVFRSMFTSGYKESSTGVVEMKDKEYDNVLEFLLVLHPSLEKNVNGENVYDVLCLADHYQITVLIKACKRVLEDTMVANIQMIDGKNGTELQKTNAAITCLTILSTALLYSYVDIKHMAASAIPMFGSKVFLEERALMTLGAVYKEDEWEVNEDQTLMYKKENHHLGGRKFIGFFGHGWIENYSEVLLKRKECREIYNALPDSIKIAILQNRLEKCDDDKFHDPDD